MLTAMVENGERICLGDRWSREELVHLREEEKFICPQCKENVILKLGERRIYHFSHIRRTTCESHYETESEYHMLGKLQLYQWLKEQGLEPELEFFDSSINQRMDVFFIFNNQRYALEYQCCSINHSIFLKRTSGYLSKGYKPLWILGGNQLNRRKQSLITLTDFHYLFLQKTPSNSWMIPFYCSSTKKFIIHNSIQPVTIKNIMSVQQIYATNQLSVKLLLDPPKIARICPRNWLQEITLFKSRMIRYPGSYDNPFLKTLYNHYLHIFFLPPYLGLPLLENPCVVTPPLIWQTYLFVDVLMKRDINIPFTLGDMGQAFLKRVLEGHIQIRRMAFINSQDGISSLIQQYLLLLVKVRVLTMLSNKSFVITQPIIFPKTMNEQNTLEQNFYREFSNIIFEK